MKTLKTTLFISLTVFAQTAIKAQVTNAWDWPSNIGYSFFGANGNLPQNGVTGQGNYALLQSKNGGSDNYHTFLNSPQVLHFRINNAEKMTLANNGNFGIGTGTTAPAQKLDVNGNIVLGTPSAFTAGTSGLLQFRRPGDGAVPVVMGMASDNEFAFKQYGGSSYFSFWTNEASGNIGERMRITYGGNIGIGTTSPQTQLDVNSVASFRGNSVTIGGITNHSNERVYLVYDNGIGYGRLMGQANVGLSFGTNYQNDRLIINPAGNVGIGTTIAGLNSNPNNYKLAVNGTIGAKAIRVETTSGAWSDYVFEKDYELKTIKELEAYVTKNKHLPNVPSACEVEEKGIDMATMDATLLAKIEELSLYIIEQNKKLEAQNARIEALEKR